MAERRTIERAIRSLDRGAEIVDVVELVGGISAEVHRVAYRESSGDIREVVFRQHRTAAFKGHDHRVTAREYSVLSALWRSGLRVPRPLLLDDGGSFTAPFLLTEWVAGSTEVAPSRLPGALDQMADFLARLHDLDPLLLDASDLEELEEPLTVLTEYLPADDVGAGVAQALESGAITRVLNRPVLIHGDYWPGNVVWADGRLAAVIDWEDARVGDPLADLACARVELRCQFGPDAQRQFTRMYLERSRDRGHELALEALPLWDVYVSAAALMTMERWGLDPSEEARRRSDTYEFFTRAAADLLDPTTS